MPNLLLERPRAKRTARELVESHLPLVERIAGSRSLRRSYCHVRVADVDDARAAGMVGLIDAAVRFDEGRGLPFEAYAQIRVAGAIVDQLRSLDWVPQHTRRAGGPLRQMEPFGEEPVPRHRVRSPRTDERRIRFEARDELEAMGFFELPLRERAVLTLLYILEHTESETATLLGMSRERVEAIELTALSALRSAAEGHR